VKDYGWLAWSFGLVVLVVILAVAIPLERWLTRRRRVESGWVDWCRTARELPWADRFRLYWATAMGRAVTQPRLVDLALQRASALVKLQRGAPTQRRKFTIGLGCCYLLLTALYIFDGNWGFGVMFVWFGVLFIYVGITAGGPARSEAANRRLAERPHPQE